MVQLNLGVVQIDVSIAQLTVSIMAVCLAAIGLIIKLSDRKTKFRLFVYPDQGYVSLGGSIASEHLFVKGIYRNKVALSVPNEPHGVRVAFAPNTVVPKGFLNFFDKFIGISTISINVSRDAEDGLYPIVIVGAEEIGSGSSTSSFDGRWQNSCTYHLFAAMLDDVQWRKGK